MKRKHNTTENSEYQLHLNTITELSEDHKIPEATL